MVEAVAGERRVVRLDVQLVLAVEAVADEEAVDGRGVVVVLVLRGLHRLRLDEERPLEPDLRLVLGDEVEEAGELLPLALQVGVEERVVALAPAPQDVVGPAEALRHLEHHPDLGRGVREDLGVRVRRGAGLVARVREEVRGPPEEGDTGPLLVAERVVHQRVQVGPELREAVALGRDVAVVEAVVGDAELLDELERDRHLLTRRVHRVGIRVEPRTVERPDPEHVPPVPGEGMPEADADPEVLLHPLPEHDAVRVVDLVRQRVGRPQPAEGDRSRHLGEEVATHGSTLRYRTKRGAASPPARSC